MKTIATLTPEYAQLLAAFLVEQGIACETRNTTDENGIDAAEVLVQDDIYESACKATEIWDAEMLAEDERRTSRRCPTCNSPHVEYIKDIDYEKTMTKIMAIYRCKDCNRVFAPKR
ncbi:MAG: hypothetical protein PHR77_20050 [Kiritimatiellae bacterium]|nr:hypothetical protein [Kiritimatiellia bacterium]MDD5522772.1 hypothetical protein [Kiritimatiellia bacterium]